MTKQQIKALWKLCFDDSDAFIDMYFRLRYNDEVNIAIESGKEVVSALQMIPYPMTFCGEQIPTSYISGACTHPDFRGNGVMRELLSQAFARMRYNRVVPVSYTQLDVYKRQGSGRTGASTASNASNLVHASLRKVSKSASALFLKSLNSFCCCF